MSPGARPARGGNTTIGSIHNTSHGHVPPNPFNPAHATNPTVSEESSGASSTFAMPRPPFTDTIPPPNPELDSDPDSVADDDPVHLLLKQKWSLADAHIADLFRPRTATWDSHFTSAHSDSPPTDGQPAPTAIEDPPPRRAARTIDEDDYGDDDDDEDVEPNLQDQPQSSITPPLTKDKSSLTNGNPHSATRSPSLSLKPTETRTSTTSSDHAKSSEHVRKKLEEDKRAAEDAAKRSFHTMFYTLESDRDAMLEQQKLDELDRQVENEMSNGQGPTSASNAAGGQVQGSLSTADLGASSLTLKNLIARIDAKRNLVNANDTQLRTLISEVRKGRSKWASEDKIGQEELYEASEKVLMELKAMTEYSTPFLQRVNKRDAPDYFHIIKHPMDIGSMIKKLKTFAYKSKKEFVSDLSLIWSNCLTYNGDPNHPLRKKALYMRKETDKLVPLIPDITVRDRAEVEAEERRLQNLDIDLEGGEDSDDDQPIMASRGRKAPSKGKKGQNSMSRKGPETDSEATPAVETKPAPHASTTSLRNELLRADSDAPADASSNGFSTPPPPGMVTPLGTNGLSQPYDMEVDGGVSSLGLNMSNEDPDEDDAEFKTWKQVTKKDRAMAATERNRLFRGDHLNPDEPALLRTKAGMRRWLRQQKQFSPDSKSDADQPEPDANITGETLAEGIEKDQDRTLPDYYDTLTSIPALSDELKWVEDSEGKVVPQTEAYLRLFPSDQFKSTDGALNRRVEANMRQMQETRKVCAKIGIVKQMQIQAQTYQNQFQKYDPEPFLEQNVGPLAVSEEGPLMAPWVNRAAFQRAVGKVFYHAGFEDFQPSALEAATDVAADFFSKLIRNFTTLKEVPKTESATNRFTPEEQVLHTLHRSGLDLESLETYVNEDVDRLNSKLVIVHERMKAHLADLLRPALGENVGADGAGAFQDGSDQFVGGDFAEDIDEDFFGFKELGLAAEFGLESLSVPLHLLQNRMHSAYQAHNTHSIVSSGIVFTPPSAYEPLSTDNLPTQIGLVQDFFATKLAANQGRPLVEDEDLPQKQRFPRPRLPPNGRISSPRKRPIREQQQAAKKKRKLEENKDDHKATVRAIAPLKLPMPEKKERANEPEKDVGAMMSPPESIAAN